jgi:phospholipid/cholesterol/gamma-HCH transport system permease protein
MTNIAASFLRGLAGAARGTLRHAAGIGRLAWQSAVALVRGKVSGREIVAQMYATGVQSIPLVMVTSTLSGIVTSQQGGYQFTSSIPLYVLGSVVTQGIIMELAPVLTAIVLVGRVGARITAELGTMKVSEQIDALYSLGRDPVAVLAAPRIIGCTLAMPVLVALSDAMGVMAGIFAADLTVNLGAESFLYGARMYWHSWDLFYCFVKATTFGFIIPLISTHMGFLTSGGAEGVGRATTASVVFMIIAVLVSDAMFPSLLLT